MNAPERPKAGDIVVRGGRRWRVHCEYAGTLGLAPVGIWHRLYWWWRFLRLR